MRLRCPKHRVAPGGDWAGVGPGGLLHALAECLIEARAVADRFAEHPGHFRGSVRALPGDWIVDYMHVAKCQRPFVAAQPSVAAPHSWCDSALEQIQRSGQAELAWVDALIDRGRILVEQLQRGSFEMAWVILIAQLREHLKRAAGDGLESQTSRSRLKRVNRKLKDFALARHKCECGTERIGIADTAKETGADHARRRCEWRMLGYAREQPAEPAAPGRYDHEIMIGRDALYIGDPHIRNHHLAATGREILQQPAEIDAHVYSDQ